MQPAEPHPPPTTALNGSVIITMKGTDIEIKPYDPSQACGDGQGIRDIVRDMGDALQDIIHAHDTAYSRGLGTTAKSLRRIMADLDGRREHLMRLHEGGGVQTS